MTTYESTVERTLGGNRARFWLLRAALVAVAGVALWQSQLAFRRFSEFPPVTFHYLWGEWALALMLIALAGAAFALAVRVPFSLRGLSWTPLVLAVVAALPIAHFMLVWTGVARDWPNWFNRIYWLDSEVSISAALVGVALAFVIGGARRRA